MWNDFDGLDVFGYVFTNFSITTSSCLNQHSIFITNADCKTIDLQFTDERHVCIVEALHHALAPGLQFVWPHCVVEAGHWCAVCNRSKRGNYWRTNLQSWRIKSDEFGKLCFKRLQFTLQFVVFSIANLWRIVSEIAFVMQVDGIAQKGCAVAVLLCCFCAASHRCNITCGLHYGSRLVA